MDPQEESSRFSVRSPHPETLQSERSFHPDIKSPAETPVSIKQSANPQKLQKLPETTNKSFELPEPSESNKSDSDTSEPSQPPMSSIPLPGPDPDLGSGLSNE